MCCSMSVSSSRIKSGVGHANGLTSMMMMMIINNNYNIKCPSSSSSSVLLLLCVFLIIVGVAHAGAHHHHDEGFNQQQFPISSSSQQQLRKRNNNNNANFSSLGQEESAARDFINVLDHEASRFIKMVSLARWNCGTNMSEATQAKLIQAEAQSSHGLAQVLNLLRDSFGSSGAYANWKNYEDPFLVRLIWKSAKQNSIQDRHGPKASKSVNELTKKMMQLLTDIRSYSNTAGFGASFNPHSTNAGERLLAWNSFREMLGRSIKPYFIRYLHTYQRELAAVGTKDPSEELISEFEVPKREFHSLLNSLWEALVPLYKKLHAYVRYRLVHVFPDVVTDGQPLPAHLAGDMYVTKFTVPADDASPFKNTSSLDVNEALRSNGHTVTSMFRLAERFFTSVGFDSLLSPVFWKNSVLEDASSSSDGHAVDCQNSVWDFNFGHANDDYRVKGCTKVTAHHLKTAHQLLTQIAYDSSNTHLPRVFRTPPFPGFVEALGGAITLSLDSVKHLEAVDLAKKNSEGDSSASMRHGADINFLLAKALGVLASMPFALTTERWRWDVWQNRVPKEKMNSHWWRLRREVQGVAAPNDRSDSLHLDPVGIPEVAGHQPIISQFLSSVLQFQFYEAMCQAAGQYKPNSPGKQRLHHCNLYNNKRAGEILKNIMRSGSSVHWKTLLHRTTGFSTFSLQPLLRYFAPLDAYLDKF
ncbi:unnamed protein product, partial [Notodromas monacha]